MTKQKGGSGYVRSFKRTLSPCYDKVQKVGWHGGKSKTRKSKTKRGGARINTCQNITQSWYNQGENPASSKIIDLSSKVFQQHMTRTLPNGDLYTAAQLKMTPQCGTRYIDVVPTTGGAKKTRSRTKVTVGKDGKKYYFRNGKRVSNPKTRSRK